MRKLVGGIGMVAAATGALYLSECSLFPEGADVDIDRTMSFPREIEDVHFSLPDSGRFTLDLEVEGVFIADIFAMHAHYSYHDTVDVPTSKEPLKFSLSDSLPSWLESIRWSDSGAISISEITPSGPVTLDRASYENPDR